MSTTDGHSLITSDPETRRALALDTLAAILPMDRRDCLAELLTDDDVATLTHLARAGMGANTLRALASDLAYLETGAWAVLAGPLPWPAPEALILRFVAHHLWDPVQREAFASGGRRRSEAAALRVADLIEREPVPADPKTPDGPTLPALSLRLGRTKAASAEQDERVLLIGRPVEALRAWLHTAGIKKGAVFREITRWGQL